MKNDSPPFLATVARDLRFGLRMLMRSPGLTVISICALAIGMALSVALFSIINGTLFATMPYEKGEELYSVNWDKDRWNEMLIQWDDFHEFARQQSVFSEVAGNQTWPANVRIDEYTESIPSSIISPNLFRTLRVAPVLGPGFPASDLLDADAPVVTLGHELWKERFAGAADVIGRTLIVDRLVYTIVGVMPEGFDFPYGSTQLWTVESQSPQKAAIEGPVRGAHLQMVVGRIPPPANGEAAAQEWNTIAKRLALQFPDSNRELQSVRIVALSERYGGSYIHRLLWTLQVVAILVAVIACLNVAILILANLFRRSGELAVRSSMGASRRRICQQIVTEALLISLIGGTCGIILALVGSDLVWSRFSANLWTQNWMDNHFSYKSACLLCVIVAVTAVAAGLLPAVQVSRAEVSALLNQGDRIGANRHAGRMLRLFSVLQVAISYALLICTLFFLDIGRRIAQVPYPYDPEKILFGRILIDDKTYPNGPAKNEGLRKIQSELSALPGVRAVSFSSGWNTAGGKTITGWGSRVNPT